MTNETMKKLVEKRNYLFLGMCCFVHIFLMILFAVIGITGMVLLNVFSALFYIFIFFIKKDFSENSIVASYFEIIFFATLSTIMLGRQAGFVLYIVGMISVVFYLAYHHQNKRFIYQGIGALVVLSLVIMEPQYSGFFAGYKAVIGPHGRLFYIMNLLITLVTVVIVSFLYAQEINQMNREIVEINAELDYQASHDELTGLLNRHEMNRYLDEIANTKTKQVMVAMMDVDDFKKINDTYGHGAGDLVLKAIAGLMKKYLKDFKVARWGGEEFLVVSELCDRKQSFSIMKEFHSAVEELTLDYENQKIEIYITVGLVYGGDPGKINHLILEADNLLYIGKKNGKNRILTYDNIQEFKQEGY